MPELELSRGRCRYCQNQGRAFVKCNTCGVFLILGGFCIWPKLFLQTSFTRSWNLFALLNNTKPAICALFLVHYFVKDQKLTIHLVSFTLPVSYYNEFFAIKNMSSLEHMFFLVEYSYLRYRYLILLFHFYLRWSHWCTQDRFELKNDMNW